MSLRFTDFIIQNKCLETERDPLRLPLTPSLENAHRLARHLVAEGEICNSLKSLGNGLQIVSEKGWQMDQELSVEADRGE